MSSALSASIWASPGCCFSAGCSASALLNLARAQGRLCYRKSRWIDWTCQLIGDGEPAGGATKFNRLEESQLAERSAGRRRQTVKANFGRKNGPEFPGKEIVERSVAFSSFPI